MDHEITLKQIEEFKQFLMGNAPESMTLSKRDQPKLTADRANCVIWYLQGHLRVLPDNYEMCDVCGELYDANCSGHLGRLEEGTYCDNCNGD